jgi:hypothetical protein
MFCLPLSVGVSEDPIAFYTPENEIAGLAGIRREDEDSGVVWMLCTKAVEKYPILFCKQAKQWIDSQSTYTILHNVADPRNTLHMKLLSFLGFKRLGFLNVGPSRLTFVEFAKIVPCALQ